MNQNIDKPDLEGMDDWIKKNLGAAVHKLIDKGVIDSSVVEAKPAWVLPFQILIGKIRSNEQQENFKWFICGEVPTDYLESAVAETPREVARHFSMKWQLTASRYQGRKIDLSTSEIAQEDVINNLISQSQDLYSLVEDNSLCCRKIIYKPFTLKRNRSNQESEC